MGGADPSGHCGIYECAVAAVAWVKSFFVTPAEQKADAFKPVVTLFLPTSTPTTVPTAQPTATPAAAPSATPTAMPTSDSNTLPSNVNEQNPFGLTLPLNNIEYNNGYGTFVNQNGNTIVHDGYDQRSASGDTRVLAMAAGEVAWEDTTAAAVGIRSESGIEIQYTHVDSAAKGLLQEHQKFQQGELIGNYGMFGDTDYEHLHTTFRIGPERRKVDPGLYWPTGRPTNWTFGSLAKLPTATPVPR